MSYNKMNKSHGLSYDETMFLSYQKGGWSLLIRRLSINVTLKSSLLVARIEKSSKSGAWLQNKRCSLMAESSSPLTPFPVNAEIPNYSHILTLKWCLVLAK